MTAKNLYEGVLIELNKENAPNLLLEDFNYFANKAINQYVNKRYNIYDVNQQTTDDLRVLKATAMLTPIKSDKYNDLSLASMATYYVDLPSDYLHLLNCICIYQVKKTFSCYNAGDTWRAAATRLTADAYSQVIDNFWLKPTYKRPYYYIHNINTNEYIPTNPYVSDTVPVSTISELQENTINDWGGQIQEHHDYELIEDGSGYTEHIYYEVQGSENHLDGSIIEGSIINHYFGGTDVDFEDNSKLDFPNQNKDCDGNNIVQGTRNPSYITIGNGNKISNIERGQGIRYGNVSKVRLEIRYGTDDSIFTLGKGLNGNTGKIYIDYIKTPQHIRLTQKELDYTEDKSQILEFPDYVCQEILNELVHLIMENISDQRLQTHPVVSQSIANPAQAQAPQAAQGQAAPQQQ